MKIKKQKIFKMNNYNKNFNSPFTKGLSLFKKIKYAIQRIRYGYCDLDLLNFSSWFLDIIPKMLYKASQNTGSIALNNIYQYFKESNNESIGLTEELEDIKSEMENYRSNYYLQHGSPIERLDRYAREGIKYNSILEDDEYQKLVKRYSSIKRDIDDYYETNFAIAMEKLTSYLNNTR